MSLSKSKKSSVLKSKSVSLSKSKHSSVLKSKAFNKLELFKFKYSNFN